MNNLGKRLSCALLFAAALLSVAVAQNHFTQLTSDVVIANKELADELRSLSWQQASGTWVPDNAQVLQGLKRLHNREGADEIAASAIGGIDMGPSIRVISLSRYQVFGLVFGDRRQILYDASPKRLSSESAGDDPWLKQTLS